MGTSSTSGACSRWVSKKFQGFPSISGVLLQPRGSDLQGQDSHEIPVMVSAGVRQWVGDIGIISLDMYVTIYIYHYNMHIDHCIFPILMAFWWALCPPIWWDFLPKRRRTRHSTMRGEILLHPVSGWKVLLGTCCSLNPYLGWWFQMVLIYKDHLFLNIEPVD